MSPLGRLCERQAKYGAIHGIPSDIATYSYIGYIVAVGKSVPADKMYFQVNTPVMCHM